MPDLTLAADLTREHREIDAAIQTFIGLKEDSCASW